MPPISNYPMDRARYRVVKGVQNEILFFVRDIDRKPASTEYFKTLTMNIIEPETGELLLTRALTLVDTNKGIFQLTLLPGDTPTWLTGWLRWSITVTRYDGTTVMLWTDLGYAPYGIIEVYEPPNQEPVTTQVLTSSDLMLLTDKNTYTSPLRGAAQDGFDQGMQTFTCALTNFTGVINVQASLASQPDSSANSADWFTVDTATYQQSTTGTVVFNEQGSYVWVRLLFVISSGSVDEVQYKS